MTTVFEAWIHDFRMILRCRFRNDAHIFHERIIITGVACDKHLQREVRFENFHGKFPNTTEMCFHVRSCNPLTIIIPSQSSIKPPHPEYHHSQYTVLRYTAHWYTVPRYNATLDISPFILLARRQAGRQDFAAAAAGCGGSDIID